MKPNDARIVEIVPYDLTWPIIFQQEARRIQNALTDRLSSIYHIGSTSIPNMPAKPIIDILVVIDDTYDTSSIETKLIRLGYAPLRRQIVPHVSFITSRVDGIGFHLHLHERGSPQINRHLNFRDYVIAHPDAAKQYAELKLQLAQQHPTNLLAYVSGKTKWVQSIDAKAKIWDERKKDYLSPNTGPLARDWDKKNIIWAMEANLNVHMTHFSQYLSQIELIRIPGFTLVNSKLAEDTFNYVLDADFTLENAKEKIAEITDFYMRTNSPFSWWVSPNDKPHQLADRLVNLGYENTENHHAMYFDLDAWNGQINSMPVLKIVRATDKETLRDFALILANDETAFEAYFSWIASILTDEDPIEYYVGYIDGKPVVRGLTCYFGQVAGLYWLSAAPTIRHKGYGRAMQLFQLQRAKSLGYHLAVLQASGEAYPFYSKLGYQACGHYFREFKKIRNN